MKKKIRPQIMEQKNPESSLSSAEMWTLSDKDSNVKKQCKYIYLKKKEWSKKEHIKFSKIWGSNK